MHSPCSSFAIALTVEGGGGWGIIEEEEEEEEEEEGHFDSLFWREDGVATMTAAEMVPLPLPPAKIAHLPVADRKFWELQQPFSVHRVTLLAATLWSSRSEGLG